MARDNTVTIEGNLTRDPELTFSAKGNAIMRTGLAWNQSSPDGQGGWNETAHFFDVTVFGDAAEHASTSLSKGMRVLVYGRLDYSTWSAEDGSPRSKVAIVAESVAPSLKWATAEVSKVAKTTAGSTMVNDVSDDDDVF